ncbi:MAG: DUF2752 domain-containing protein [Acidobacteriia bacterium]|nr:DUF2752 domain-containing protein [Terriglobia bacterium]
MAARIPYLRLAAAVATFAALWCFTPAADPSVRLCGFHWLTGRDCPLCGLTRGVFALAKGHWSQAIHFNALSPLGFTMLFALVLDAPRLARLWTFGIAAFAIYGILRLSLL